MRTDAFGGQGSGCFSLVQVAAAWNGNSVSIHYIQKGCTWQMQPGTLAPDLAIMVNFYQYKAVESLMAALQGGTSRWAPPAPAFAPQAHTSWSPPQASCRQTHTSWEPQPQANANFSKFGLF
jgi:hypothetical protein